MSITNKMSDDKLLVRSPNITYTDDFIEAEYEYENVRCRRDTNTNIIQVNEQTETNPN